MIKKFFREFFLLQARQWRRSGFANRAEPVGTTFNALSELQLKTGELWRELAKAFR